MKGISTRMISSDFQRNISSRIVDFESTIQTIEYDKNFKPIFCCSCIDVSTKSPHRNDDYRAMTNGGSIKND
jgi:hypothetical protein